MSRDARTLTLPGGESFPVALDDEDLVRDYLAPLLLERVEDGVPQEDLGPSDLPLRLRQLQRPQNGARGVARVGRENEVHQHRQAPVLVHEDGCRHVHREALE